MIFRFKTRPLHALEDWHPWFAWRPVEVEDEYANCTTYAWLTRIERRVVSYPYPFLAPDRYYRLPRHEKQPMDGETPVSEDTSDNVVNFK